jgi:hypothetical protein
MKLFCRKVVNEAQGFIYLSEAFYFRERAALGEAALKVIE